MKEFNLSEWVAYWIQESVPADKVKEFIQRLKTELSHWEEMSVDVTKEDRDQQLAVKEIWRRIKERIDKLAGEKLR